MEYGEDGEEGEANLYKEETREDLVDSDEISAEEEAFMSGYDVTEESTEKTEQSEEEPGDIGEESGKKVDRKPRKVQAKKKVRRKR